MTGWSEAAASWLDKLGAILIALGEPAFWTVSSSHRVVGSLVYRSGEWRLSWFPDADPRLCSFPGPVTEEPADLAERLATWSGLAVSIDPVIG